MTSQASPRTVQIREALDARAIVPSIRQGSRLHGGVKLRRYGVGRMAPSIKTRPMNLLL